MATLAYPYSVRDSTNSTTDNRKTGLTATVSNGKTLAASPATVTASGNVTVVEVGYGDYLALYDPEVNGDASFPVDWGSALTNPNDRYGTLILTRDSGRVLGSLTASGSNLSATALELLGPYLVVTGTLSPASTVDTYVWAGVAAATGVRYYVGLTSGYYAWSDGTYWYLTSTAPGVTLPSAYFRSASGATAVGPYTAQGSATGTPAVASHGNAVLASYQPEISPATAASVAALASSLAAGVTLTSAGLDQVMIESGINARQALSGILAAEAGAITGNGTSTILCKSPAGVTRITATMSGVDRVSTSLSLPT